MLRDAKISLIFILLLSCSQSIYAQVEEENIGIESTEEQEEFQFRIRAKMSVDEFLSDPDIYLHFINAQQHIALLRYISETGKLLDLTELQTIREFSEKEYRALQRMISISIEPMESNQRYIKFTSRSIHQSSVDTNYLGNAWAQYQVLKLKGKHGFVAGLALEQDIGEPYVFHHLFGFDQQSFYVARKWKNMELNIGDFQLFHGFGILVGQGFSGVLGAGGISNFVQHKWIGKASGAEYNFFHGLYYRVSLRNFTYAIGYSKQKNDDGISGYHRTATEIAKKNTNKEGLLLLSLEKSNRTHREVFLYLFDVYNKQHYGSIALQYSLRSMLYFTEMALYQKSKAFTVGFSLLISPNSMMNVSYFHSDSAYQSSWNSYSIQGFNEQVQHGFVANINFKLRYNWLVNCTYRISIKHPIIEIVNTSYIQYYSMRLDRSFRNKVSISSIIQYQGDAENTSKMIRTKSILRIKNNEQFTREFQVYLNNNTDQFSKGIGVELSSKLKRIKAIYSIGYFDVTNKLPLYYGVDLLNQGTQHIGVFANGFIQSIGFQCTVFRHYQFGLSYFINEVTSINKIGIYFKRK
jgi:hypothetical protein